MSVWVSCNGLFVILLFKTLYEVLSYLSENITTVFVDTRLSKRKHPRKRFQNFRQSCVLSRSEGHTSGCDWWISIRSVDNTHDWRKFWQRFRGCFLFESRVSTKTVVTSTHLIYKHCGFGIWVNFDALLRRIIFQAFLLHMQNFPGNLHDMIFKCNLSV